MWSMRAWQRFFASRSGMSSGVAVLRRTGGLGCIGPGAADQGRTGTGALRVGCRLSAAERLRQRAARARKRLGAFRAPGAVLNIATAHERMNQLSEAVDALH